MNRMQKLCQHGLLLSVCMGVLLAAPVAMAKSSKIREWWDGLSARVGAGPGAGTANAFDETAFERINLKIERELTRSEQNDLNDLKKAILHISEIFDNMSDIDVLHLEKGRSVSGRELKRLWSRTRFVINEKQTQYRNGQATSEADFHYGSPIVRFNIDIIRKYKQIKPTNQDAAVEFLILHELSHMTLAGRQHYTERYKSDKKYTACEFDEHERFVNDIARAIGHYGGLTVLSKKEADQIKGYSPGEAKLFISEQTRLHRESNTHAQPHHQGRTG